MWYRWSTKARTYKENEKLLDENKYRESVTKLEEAEKRNLEKRAYYEQKYPDLK